MSIRSLSVCIGLLTILSLHRPAAAQERSQGQAEGAAESQPARDGDEHAAPDLSPPTASEQDDGQTDPSAALPADGDEITLDDWDRDDWMLLKPKLSLVDLKGYLRVRGDLLRKLDFDNGSQWEQTPRYWAASDGKADFTSTNMRLRIEPRINVTEQIQIITTFDILDNIVLGSTPDSISATAASTPVHVLSRNQRPPVRGDNALTDSIVARRVYARLTALNEQLDVRMGRMPDHFGLGMLMNSGDCLDCDYGQVVDRLAITFRAANHLFTPTFDWISNGPVAVPFGREGGQPLDALRWDDAVQYTVRVLRVDHPRDILESVLQGDTVLNYGLHNGFRVQQRDLGSAYYSGGYDPARQPTGADLALYDDERRDAFIYTGDAYLKLYRGSLELGVEAAVEYGRFKDSLGASSDGADGTQASAELQSTQVLKLGAVLEAKLRLEGEYAGTSLWLKAGGASGDSRRGFGALDQAETQRGPTERESYDLSLENFQFSPDYHVDLLMFRRILGAVTDAVYVRPEVAYMFDEKVQGSLAAVYSRALFKRSVPGDSPHMGLEFDAELSYGLASADDNSPLKAALAGGILFPFGAFKNLAETDDQGGSFAWTIQGRLYVTF
jgi:uncharacterized protein (TIGR04551 family)